MATVENEWYKQAELVAELEGAVRQAEPSRAEPRRRFTEVCNFADASWLTWLESERRGRSERRSLPALEELKRAYRRRSPLSLSISLVTSLLCHPPSSPLFSISLFFLSFFHTLLWHAFASFHLFIFRHSRISFLLRSSRSCFVARGTLFCLFSSVLFLSFRRRMARRRPDPRAYRSESKRRSWPKRDGRCFAPSVPISFPLSVSPSLPCRVPYEREKDGDRRWRKREGDG